MTEPQEKLLQETHDAVTRLEARIIPDVAELKLTVYGNEKPGLKEDVAMFRKFQAEYEASLKEARELAPEKQSNALALVAIFVAIISPFIAAWFGN